MSNAYVVEGWRPFNRFHRPVDILAGEGMPKSRFSIIVGPDEAFTHEHLADRHLVKVTDPSAVKVYRYESEAVAGKVRRPLP